MSGSIIWKSALSMVVLAWAILNVIPLQDTPFPDYVESQVSADFEAFHALHEKAESLLQSGKAPSYFLALRETVEKDAVDLQKFFPQIDASDIKNLNKRNTVLLNELLKRSHGKIKPGLDLNGGIAFTFRVKEGPSEIPNPGGKKGEAEDQAPSKSQLQYVRKQQLDQAIEILRKRIDGLGVAEPVIRLLGEDHIEVQMPGISIAENPDVGNSIAAPAKLVFSLVHRTQNPRSNPEPPLGYRAMVEKVEDNKTGQITEVPYYIKKIPEMEGDIIENAYAAPTEFGGYRVLLRFTPEGEDTFAKVTGNIARENDATGTIGQMAIILDGKLYSAPTVRKEIKGGAEITGRFTQREAQELANVLNNPLKIGLEIEQMNVIGPSLAKDARDASFNAFKIGAGLVILFMVLYYDFSGIVAVLSVLINIALVFGTLSSMGATVTLPGVAALVLTLGMAVDANILIFERIREELKEGKSLRSALVAGYEKALSTIVDANLTTLITASILIWMGTGAVRGFGVTLAIGIIASMFCALVVSRAMLELLINSGIVKRTMFLDFFKIRGIPFLSYRKWAFRISWLIVLIGIGGLAVKRSSIFGIDFLGGEELVVKYETELTSGEIEAVVQREQLGEVNTLSQSAIGERETTLKIQTEHGLGDRVFTALEAAFPESGLELIGKSTISASVGDEVKWSALLSIGLALVGILLYVAFRFEVGYGIGAVVATVHDIFMSVGVYVLLGDFGIGSGQFSSPMVAAVLMIIGYSLNDTIVVFDRVREELALNPGVKLETIVDLAINRTLSRTILTSLTTLLATLSLYLFGAGVVVDFALVFIIGIFTGTFSSIFIASPVFYWWHKGDRRHVEEHHDILPKYEWETTKKATG